MQLSDARLVGEFLRAAGEGTGQGVQLDPQSPFLQQFLDDPSLLGLTENELANKTGARREEMILGELFANLSGVFGRVGSELLFKVQWLYETPEWFDHRHHLLYPEKWFKDFWLASAMNIVSVTPVGAQILDLCCGDGFYDYHVLAQRASHILALDIDEEALGLAHRQHSHPKIEYQNASVLDVDYGEGVYDVISIRGAIEHFLQDKQQVIFQKSLRALKPGGWFVGDTPANPMADVDPNSKGLPSHEYEWRDEAHMRSELERTFSHVETSTLTSPDRVTLYWKCQKR